MLFKFFYIITFFFLVSCSSNKITNHLVHLNEKDTQNIPTYQTQCNEKKNYGCRDLIKAMYQSEKIQEAYQLAELYCQKGVKEGCGSLGNLYTYDGEMKKGVEIYQKGCEQKDGYSCALLAWVQFANDEVDLAFKYGNIACEKGYGPGCEIAWNALSNRQNKKEADSYIKKMWDRCETKKEGEICFFVKIYGKEIKREKINTTMQELCEKNQYNYACIAILYSDAGTSDEARVKVIK